jgi:hypothetical protein
MTQTAKPLDNKGHEGTQTPVLNLLRYCPRCGVALEPDPGASKRFVIQVAICPSEKIRISFFEPTKTLNVVKL